MNNSGKGNIKSILGILLIVLIGGGYIGTAVVDLFSFTKTINVSADFDHDFSKGENVSVEAEYVSSNLLTMKHSINYIIPTGKEYYYRITNNDYDKAIFVRAGKDFSLDYGSGESLIIKGKVRAMDYKVKDELVDYANSLMQSGIEVATEDGNILFIDAQTGLHAVMKIVASILVILGVVFIMALGAFKPKENIPGEVKSKNPMAVIVVLMILAGMLLMIYTLNFM